MTGAVGFIGMHCAKNIVDRGDFNIGVDNLNDYYDVGLKEARLAELIQYDNFNFSNAEGDWKALAKIFSQEKPER